MIADLVRSCVDVWNQRPRYGFDIETTGLRWDEAKVTTFAIYGDGLTVAYESANEEELVLRMIDLFRELDTGIVVTWNGAVFDGPFLAGRFLEHHIDHGLRLVPNFTVVPKYEPQPGFARIGFDPLFASRSGEHSHLDIAYGYWRKWAEDSKTTTKWALKPVASAVGINVIEVDRQHMDRLSQKERLAYCQSDARAAYMLAELAAIRALEEREEAL